jgi:hypothetical protein
VSGISSGEADVESFGFAGPAFVFGFGNAGGEFAADALEPGPLVRVDPQQAPDAALTEMKGNLDPGRDVCSQTVVSKSWILLTAGVSFVGAAGCVQPGFIAFAKLQTA